MRAGSYAAVYESLQAQLKTRDGNTKKWFLDVLPWQIPHTLFSKTDFIL